MFGIRIFASSCPLIRPALCLMCSYLNIDVLALLALVALLHSQTNRGHVMAAIGLASDVEVSALELGMGLQEFLED